MEPLVHLDQLLRVHHLLIISRINSRMNSRLNNRIKSRINSRVNGCRVRITCSWPPKSIRSSAVTGVASCTQILPEVFTFSWYTCATTTTSLHFLVVHLRHNNKDTVFNAVHLRY